MGYSCEGCKHAKTRCSLAQRGRVDAQEKPKVKVAAVAEASGSGSGRALRAAPSSSALKGKGKEKAIPVTPTKKGGTGEQVQKFDGVQVPVSSLVVGRQAAEEILGVSPQRVPAPGELAARQAAADATRKLGALMAQLPVAMEQMTNANRLNQQARDEEKERLARGGAARLPGGFLPGPEEEDDDYDEEGSEFQEDLVRRKRRRN